jgi:hypothetical protein
MTIQDYRTDMLHCSDAIQDSDDFIDTVDFVLATIQQQFHTVPAILSDWKQNGVEAATMWGMKLNGWSYVRLHKERLWSLVEYDRDADNTHGVIDTLLEIPGLNVTKAAFIAQLMGMEVGCIDTHNATLYDLNPETWFVRAGCSASLREAKINNYIDMCRQLGGSKKLWAVWCQFVAELYPVHFLNGRAVSRQHVLCLGGG